MSGIEPESDVQQGGGDSVTILTQYFYPEVAATAQLAFDLAIGLQRKGWRLTVLTGQPSYRGGEKLSRHEMRRGVTIRRFFNPGMDRRRAVGRLINAATSASLIFLHLLVRRNPGVILVDSTSPFLPVLARMLNMFKGTRYVFLVQDVYPDIAIKLGYMSPHGLVATVWNQINLWVYRAASHIIVLGPRMRDVVAEKQSSTEAEGKITVIHNWADGDAIVPRRKGENWFCQKHGLTDGLVIMYSGNMGATHDLESVVIAAKRLQDVSDIKFILIGDGAKRDKIARMAEEMGLRNFLLLPYQLRDVLPFSLTCGDASIVTLEPGAEGLSVPSKVYSSLAAGQAVLAIMGETCDVVDIIEEGECGQRISPGDVDGLVNAIRRLYDNPTLLQNTKENARICFDVNFSKTRAIDSYERVLRQATTK